METKKLYQEDVYLTEWDACITSVREIEPAELAETYANGQAGSKLVLLTLDATAFFPEGGGQSCDSGDINGFLVIDVQEKDGRIYHTLQLTDKTSPSDANISGEALHRLIVEAKAGDKSKNSLENKVHCALNWERRFDNMQRHCGEHILSGIFFSQYGGVNRGFHMGQDYMTIDISLEENPEITEITYAMALKAELLANQVVWSNAPVTVMRFDSREEAEKMPLRKALAFDKDISIVSVGSIENAADCVACCGTHPNTAGQVGLIKIYKVESYKGMFRIYFEAGARALKDYDSKHNILTELANKYSSSIEDFPGKLKAQEGKLRSAKDELYHIKKAFTEKECEQLDAVLASETSGVIVYPLAHFSLDDAFNMAKGYMGNSNTKPKNKDSSKPKEKKQDKNYPASARSLGDNLVMLYSEKDTSYILISDGNIDCGSLVKEYAPFYKGKGGGNKLSARAIFASAEDALLFADLIKKHLRK